MPAQTPEWVGWSVADGGAGPKWIRLERHGPWLAVQDRGVVLQSQANPNRSLTDAIGLRRLAGWFKCSCRAVLADLELVDSGSLDVLLYCTDDLVMRGEVPPRVIHRVVDR